MAIILLQDYRMKRKPVQHSNDIPATHGELMKFRDEVMSRFSAHDAQFRGGTAKFRGIDAHFKQIDARFKEVDARFDQVDAQFKQVDARFKEVDARFDALEAKMDRRFDEMQAKLDRMLAIIEEQNARNKVALDGYLIVYDRIERLERRIKPECLTE